MRRAESVPGRRAVIAGLVGLAVLVLAALAAAVLAPAHPYATTLEARLQPPGPGHRLGCDSLGRDVFSRVLYGARISLAVGGATVALSLALGVALGALAGYRGGMADELLGRLIDVLLAFP